MAGQAEATAGTVNSLGLDPSQGAQSNADLGHRLDALTAEVCQLCPPLGQMLSGPNHTLHKLDA